MAYDFVSQFAQQLMGEAKMLSLPADYLEGYQTKLEDQIVQRMGIIAVENLDDAALEEYQKIIEASGGDLEKIDKEKVVAFWQEKMPNFQEVMTKGLAEFTQEFLKNFKK